ncbi:MAG: hypothetical protein ACI4TB_09340 [Lachnospiraceae bacterium]
MTQIWRQSMTDKELRRLGRSELLEMLIAQTAENDQLKIRLEQAEAQLQNRRIAIDKAGSLAEAALSLNGVFQAAEAAAQQYLENIQRMSGQQDVICRNLKEQAEKEAAEIRQEAQAYSQKAHAEADAYWKKVVARAAKLLEDQKALREMIQSVGEIKINEEQSEISLRASDHGAAHSGA